MWARRSSRLKHQLQFMDHTMSQAALGWGQSVLWYEFNTASVEDVDSGDAGSDYDDDLYDEGGSQAGRVGNATGASRRWHRPKRVQAYQAMLNEGAQEFNPEGNYTVDELTLIVLYSELQKKISDPDDRGAHVNDRIGYDNRIFSVDSFNPRGRIGDRIMTVTVRCMEVKDDEMQLDGQWYEHDGSQTVHPSPVLAHATVSLPVT